jgi:tetratricopeptide (TPR) repeat protein
MAILVCKFLLRLSDNFNSATDKRINPVDMEKNMTNTGMNGVASEAEYLYRQAREKVDLGEYQHAITILNRAIEITPHYPQALIELGNCFDYINRYDDAVSFYEKVIAVDPFYADAWFNKGVCLKKMNRGNDALPCIEKAIELYCGR